MENLTLCSAFTGRTLDSVNHQPSDRFDQNLVKKTSQMPGALPGEVDLKLE